MRRIANIVAVAALLCSPSILNAQSGTIRGRVTDPSGNSLVRATLSVDGTNIQTGSNDQGNYELRGVPAGTQVVRVRLIGYVPQSAAVIVPAGGQVTRDFRLETTPIGLAAIDVVVGSRARHATAEELAVPVDIFTSEELAQQGTTEMSQIIQALSPAVNFPRQSVTDATDIARPFTLRGLSPDHTLVLVNGYRRHQMAVVNTFAYGTPAGSSGVDMNTIPSSAIERVEVLRDGAAAQYGSDAIAGVVNLVLKQTPFAPFLTASFGSHYSGDYAEDGATLNVAGGIGLPLGRGSISLFAEYLNRDATNRAWADPFDGGSAGVPDSVGPDGQVIVKNNAVPQPNTHWGDGIEEDIHTMANFRLPLNAGGTSEIFAFGGYSTRTGTGNGYRRYSSDRRNFASIYPEGFLPEFNPDATDYSATAGLRGLASGWLAEVGASMGHNDFQYNLRNTLNTTLGPSTTVATAPGGDGILGNGDDPGIPNQTSFFAGAISRDEYGANLTLSRGLNFGLRAPVNVAVGAQFRSETFEIEAGELASYIDGGHLGSDSADAPSGSQVFAGFDPSNAGSHDRTNVGVYLDLETSMSPGFLIDVAARFENYSDFGSSLNGKVALRLQPNPRLVLRGAISSGFRAPGLGQQHFSKVVTNVIGGNVEEVGVFPVGHAASVALGAVPLKEENSINMSAGVALQPSERLTLTADFFNIALTDRIILGATFDDAATLGILAANGFSNVTGVQYFTNGLDTKTQGFDFTANLRLPVGQNQLEFIALGNYTKTTIDRVDGLPQVLVNAGSTEPGLIDTVTALAIEQERPDWRATLTTQYTAGRLRGLVRASYYGAFRSAQPGYCDNCGERYGSKTLFDLELGYRLGRLELALGARNLLDTYPDKPSSTRLVDPTDPTAGTSAEWNTNFGVWPWAAASPFGYNGRYLYTRLGITLPR